MANSGEKVKKHFYEKSWLSFFHAEIRINRMNTVENWAIFGPGRGPKSGQFFLTIRQPWLGNRRIPECRQIGDIDFLILGRGVHPSID